MNTQAKNVPKLRFPEFNNSWGKKKLGEVATIERGRFSPRPRNDPKYYGGNIPFVQTGDVVKAKGTISNFSQTLNELGLGVSKLFPKGTILITVAANIGHSGILEKDMACPDSLIGIKCKPDTNNTFLNYYLSTQQPRMDRISSEAAQKNINIEFLKPYQIAWTRISEQKKIAEFLTAVDEKVESMDKKVELLKRYKKGVMQKIFSQEIRFKDENGKKFPDWEESELGDAINVSMGQSPSSKYYNEVGDGLYLIQGNADIKKRRTSPRIWTRDITKTCDVGDLILTVRAPSGYVAISNHKACIGRGVAAITAKKEVNKNFVYQFLLWFEPTWKKIEQGSTFTAISGNDIRSINIMIPSLKEQAEIAGFLTSIDKKIELQERRLAQARDFKKSLLQQMFV